MNKYIKLIKQKEYDFLREDKNISNLMLLTLGGSHSYGTNVESSDVDIRGISYNTKEKLLGLDNFEQFVDPITDTTIYGFSKMIPLLMSNNPNTLELFGCKDEHYLLLTKEGKLLKDNINLFLSQIASHSFSGYATQQLRRLQNAIMRDSLTEELKEEHIKKTLENTLIHFKQTYTDFENGSIIFNVENELNIDINLKNYPIRSLVGILAEMNSIIKSYDKIGHRNNKKDDLHLNKHSLHLIRLLKMGIEILSEQSIKTYRDEDHDLLMEIRNGKYLLSDGTYHSDFFDLVKELEKEFEYAKKNTCLPEKPDKAKIQELVMEINLASLK